MVDNSRAVTVFFNGPLGYHWSVTDREVSQAWHWDFHSLVIIFWQKCCPPVQGTYAEISYFILKILLIFILCIWVFCLHVYLFTMCVQCVYSGPRGQKKALDPLGLESCELPRGCWESNTGPLKEQPMQDVLVTTICKQRYRLWWWQGLPENLPINFLMFKL